MSINIKNSIPSNIPDWCDLFNHSDFYTLHKTNSSHYFSIFQDSKLIGLCNFTEVENNIYRSPFRGTYGNISFIENLDLSIKDNCVDALLVVLKENNINKIEIVSEPFAHNIHNVSSLFNIYLSKSFTILNQEINHSLTVDDKPMIDKMMRNNKKRFKKCVKANFIFEQVSSHSDIKVVYETIKENREENNYSMSMSLLQILEMYKVFPENIYFFKVSQSEEVAAASICMKLNNNILYVFYWGDRQYFKQYSPVVLLANGIYTFAQEKKFNLIDAGTSSIHGEPNFGVATFKENLGFKISSKITYAKEL